MLDLAVAAVTDRDIWLAILARDYASQWLTSRGSCGVKQKVEDRTWAGMRELKASCGFQSIPITHSIPFRSRIPGDSDQ